MRRWSLRAGALAACLFGATSVRAGERARGLTSLEWTRASGTGEPFVVRTQDAEHPIYLAAYMTGCGGDYWGTGQTFKTKGDPEFVNVVPVGQYLGQSAFFADPTYAETSLVVVREKTEGVFKDVELECLGGSVTGFRQGVRGTFLRGRQAG